MTCVLWVTWTSTVIADSCEYCHCTAVLPHLRRMWREFLLGVPDLAAFCMCDLTVWLLLFSVCLSRTPSCPSLCGTISLICSGRSSGSLRISTSKTSNVSDLTGRVQQKHLDYLTVLIFQNSLTNQMLSEHGRYLITDAWSLCLCYSTSGNWIAEWATDWRWTDCWGRRPHQGSLENKRSVISDTDLFKCVTHSEYM